VKRKDRAIRVDRQVSLMLLALLLICFALSAFITRSIFLKYTQDHLGESAESVFDYLQEQELHQALLYSGFYNTNAYTMNEEVEALLLSAIEFSPVQDIYLAQTSGNMKTSYYVPSSIAAEESTAEDREQLQNRSDSDYLHVEEYITAAAGSLEPVRTSTTVSSGSKSIFGFYFPIGTHNLNIKSVLAIEFSADRYLDTIRASFTIHFMIMIIMWLAAVLWSHNKFKAISNLGYKSSYNIDQMTGFKNRNAFDIDLYNINSTAAYQALTVYYVDLNDLKNVNDNRGHEAGDRYIQAMAGIIEKAMGTGDVIYRVGGDEFCVLSFNHVRSKAQAAIRRFERTITQYNEANGTDFSAAIGFAVFNFDIDADASATRARAEMRMYENKKRMKIGLPQLAEEGIFVQDNISPDSK
jgi:diguanylate cyclase (GGDEF)-like protein